VAPIEIQKQDLQKVRNLKEEHMPTEMPKPNYNLNWLRELSEEGGRRREGDDDVA
jgi:hypothetical protein